MYEKIKCAFTVIALCMLCMSCKSNDLDSTAIGERNQYVRGRLDSTIQSLDRDLTGADRTLQECLERSRRIEDLATRLKYLTTAYFGIIEHIQNANNKALTELAAMEKDLCDPGSDPGVPDNADNAGADTQD